MSSGATIPGAEPLLDAGSKVVDFGAHAATGVVKHLPFIGGAASRALDGIGDGAHALDEVVRLDAMKFLQDNLKGVVVTGRAAAELSATLSATPGVQTGNVPELAAGAGAKVEQS